MSTLSGSLSATGQSAAEAFRGRFNLTISGTFSGSVRLERSFDGGTTWFPCTCGGQIVNITAPLSEVLNEPEANVVYRVNCTARSSGTIVYRVSQ